MPEITDEQVAMSVIGYKKTPLAPEGDTWDAATEVKIADVNDLKIMCAWVGTDPALKGSYKLPHHKAGGDHACVWKGVAAAAAVLQGAMGGVDIPSADVAGVKAHIAAHYKDFDKGAAPWAGAVAAKDLVWKQLLILGTWYKKAVDGTVQRITITKKMLTEVKKAFEKGVMPHVAVPSEHTDALRANTGFVQAVEQRDNGKELWVGINFTEPDIAAMVSRGTIANVSAYLQPQYLDTRDESVWDWVLTHVALTNQPVLHLKPFAAGVQGGDAETWNLEVEGVADETKDQLMARLQQVQTDLDAEKAKRGEAEIKLSTLTTGAVAADERVKALELSVKEARSQLHAMDVKNILGALQGKGTHEAVKLIGKAYGPAVLSVVQSIFEADDRQADVSLAVGKPEKATVTEVILSVMNAMAGANGGLITLGSNGQQEHIPPAAIPDAKVLATEKEQKVDEYLLSRHLKPVTANDAGGEKK